jgi:hypothetical protein
MRSFSLSLVLSIGFLAISLRAVSRQRLREQSALLWLAVGAVMVFLSATLPLHLLDRFARVVGIAYPPDLILLLGVLFLVVLVFQQSLKLERLNEHHTTLVQEIAILKAAAPPEPDTPVPPGEKGHTSGRWFSPGEG